jgi:hypothetical protein
LRCGVFICVKSYGCWMRSAIGGIIEAGLIQNWRDWLS